MMFLIACAAPDTADDFAVSAGPIAPTLVATWTTSEPTVSTVTASFGSEVLEFTESAPTTSHAVHLLGVPPTTAVTVQRLEDGAATAEASVTTGGIPSWAPDLVFRADTPAAAEGGVTLVPIIAERSGGVIAVDAMGRTIWSYPPEDDSSDLIFRALLSLDGQHVLYNTPARAHGEPGWIYRVAVDGSTAEAVAITGGHTDFVEYTPGGYVSLGWEIREVEGRKILGDTLVERSPEGAERVLWSAWDWFLPDLSMRYPNLYAADPEVEDWTHVNGLSYDPGEDALYVTMTFDSGIAKIDRASGDLAWVVSSTDGDYDVPAPDELQLPHSVQLLEDGQLLVFNRGQLGATDATSDVTVLALDDSTMTAQATWRYVDPEGLLVPFLGGAERLHGGNTLICWSSAGQLDEVTPDGQVAWQVSTAIGAAFGFSSRYPRLGP